jgi:2-oxoglutarate dehydrogenase E1 component
MSCTRVEELLLGCLTSSHDEVFRGLGVPYEAVQWRRDVNPNDREAGRCSRSRWRSPTSSAVHRVRGHLIADLDPLRWKEPEMPVELDPATYGPHDLGPRPRVPHRRARRPRADALGDILHVLRVAYCRTIGIEYMHIQDQEEQRWIQEQVEGVSQSSTSTTSATSSSA